MDELEDSVGLKLHFKRSNWDSNEYVTGKGKGSGFLDWENKFTLDRRMLVEEVQREMLVEKVRKSLPSNLQDIWTTARHSNDMELQKSKESDALELENRKEIDVKRNNLEANKGSKEYEKGSDANNSEKKTSPVLNNAVWKRRIENGIVMLEERIKRNTLELEKDDMKLDEIKESDAFEVEERNSDHRQGIDSGDESGVAENRVPLVQEETVSIDLSDAESSVSNHVQATDTKKPDLKKKDRSTPRTSTISQIKLARQNSTSPFHYFWNAIKIMLACVGYFVYVAILSAVGIAMITIGSLYLYDCPVQPYIPIYLVVGGTFSIFGNLLNMCRKNSQDEYYCIDRVLNLFHIIWLIMGCVWVYGVKNVDFYDTFKGEYCDKTLYLFAFWLLNCTFIVMGSILVLGLCCLCCAAIAS